MYVGWENGGNGSLERSHLRAKGCLEALQNDKEKINPTLT